MSQLVDQEIRTLREHFWSARDPEGHAFAPLADAYRRKGDLDEAASLVSDGLARLPEFTPGHLVASRIFRARGELEEARAALDRLLELDGENVLALLEWAELSRDTGDHEGAISGLRRLLVLDPAHLGARSMLDRLEATVPPRAEPDGGGASEAVFPGAEAGAEDGPTQVTDATLETEPDTGSVPAVEPDLSLDPGADPAEDLEPSLHQESEPSPDPEPESILDSTAELGGASLETPADQLSGEELASEEDLDVFGFDSDLMEEVEAGEPSGRMAAEPDVSDPSGTEDPPELATRTMAELFARQGLTDRAVGIYQRLAAADPTNDELARRLVELREGRRAGESDAVPGEPVAAEAPEEETAFELETAPHLEEGPTAESQAGEVRSPRTIRDFMEDLLSWRGGAVPVSVLSPESPHELAPEGSRLAIRVAGAVPVEDLAPGAPLRTAPEGSPAALRETASKPPPAPERLSTEDDVPQPVDVEDDVPQPVEEDDDMDEFRDWLEGLRP